MFVHRTHSLLFTCPLTVQLQHRKNLKTFKKFQIFFKPLNKFTWKIEKAQFSNFPRIQIEVNNKWTWRELFFTQIQVVWKTQKKNEWIFGGEWRSLWMSWKYFNWIPIRIDWCCAFLSISTCILKLDLCTKSQWMNEIFTHFVNFRLKSMEFCININDSEWFVSSKYTRLWKWICSLNFNSRLLLNSRKI